MQISPIVPALASVLFVNTTLTSPAPADWVHTLAEAKALATTSQKPILIYCWADGSEYCTKLYQDTLSAAGAGTALSNFVCFSAKHGGAGVKEMFAQYGVQTLPTMLFVQPSGKADDLIQGFIPAGEFVVELDRIKSGKDTVSDLEARVAAATAGSEDDIDARWKLAGKVQALGEGDRHDELMASIREVDPKGKTLVGARMLLQELTTKIAGKDGYSDEESEADRLQRISSWNLAPLYAHAKSTGLKEAKHEAWQQIGNMEAKREDMQAAFKAYRAAWKTCPEDKVVDWSNDIARWVIKSAEHRTSKEKKFALELATKALATLEKRLKEDPPGKSEHLKYEKYQAYCWNTIAWALHINGKQKPAVKAATMAVKLSKTDKYLADVSTMEK